MAALRWCEALVLLAQVRTVLRSVGVSLRQVCALLPQLRAPVSQVRGFLVQAWQLMQPLLTQLR